MGSTVAVLWKWGQAQADALRRSFGSQIDALKSELERRDHSYRSEIAHRDTETQDLIARVRSLEHELVVEIKAYAEKMTKLLLRSFEEAAQNRKAVRALLQDFNDRPCVHATGAIPEPATDHHMTRALEALERNPE